MPLDPYDPTGNRLRPLTQEDLRWLTQKRAVKEKEMAPVPDVMPQQSDLPEMDPLVSTIDAFIKRHPTIGSVMPSGKTVAGARDLLGDALFRNPMESKAYGSFDNPVTRESVRAKSTPGVRYPSDPNQTSRPRQQMNSNVASPASKGQKMTIKKSSKPNPASPGDNLTDWMISIEK